MNQTVDVAIIGMSCIFPGAGDLQAFWKNIINRVDAIQTVPENRMDSVFFDGETAVDRFYCRRGGFTDEFAAFDPIQFGILPLVVESTEPEQDLSGLPRLVTIGPKRPYISSVTPSRHRRISNS